MPKDSVVIKADGKVSAADFRTVVDAFVDLMFTLTAETNSDAAVDWMIDGLQGGSATITTRGIFANSESEHTVEIVVGKYEELAQAASDGKLNRYSDRVRSAMHMLTSVVNGRIPRILMGTPENPELGKLEQRLEEVEIVEPQKAALKFRPYTRAAVKGRITTLDQKHGTYFTLDEVYGYNYVRCYPGDDAEMREKLAKYWKEKTLVIVEGTYLRYADSPTLTAITDIVALPEGEKGGWRNAIGAAPRGPKASGISSAEAVRKVRDGQA